MENLICNKKNFKILEKLGDRTYKVEFRGKNYFYKQLNSKEEFDDFIYAKKHLASSGISVAKIIQKDKKNFSIVTEFIEGETILDKLIKGPLDETIFPLVFKLSFFTKIEKFNIDFSPQHFKLCNGKLYYLETIMMPYEEANSYTNKYIYLWFYTNKFVELLKELGYEPDNNRIKPSYESNKEIVLITCKYYR